MLTTILRSCDCLIDDIILFVPQVNRVGLHLILLKVLTPFSVRMVFRLVILFFIVI